MIENFCVFVLEPGVRVCIGRDVVIKRLEWCDIIMPPRPWLELPRITDTYGLDRAPF